MQMLCYKCNHSWNYKGKNSEGQGYITCPGCLYKIRVDKALIEPLSKQKLLTNLPNKRILPKKLPTTNEIKPLQIDIKGPVYRRIIEQPKTDFIQPQEEIVFEEKICEDHNLPVSYDDIEKTWTCRKCREVKTPNAKPIIYPSVQVNEIPKEERAVPKVEF